MRLPQLAACDGAACDAAASACCKPGMFLLHAMATMPKRFIPKTAPEAKRAMGQSTTIVCERDAVTECVVTDVLNPNPDNFERLDQKMEESCKSAAQA